MNAFFMPDNTHANYIGRFAPSPTGPVHFGTLVAATGSYLQAKSNQGRWLIRMEDVDVLRNVEGADSDILFTLESMGFEWDGQVLYQTAQTDYYNEVLQQLITQSLVFPCLCSRKQLAASAATVYPGTCRNRRLPEKNAHSLRVIVQDIDIKFNDRVMGPYAQNLGQQCGDFIIKRRDGLFAYQLAVVVDDALQNISEIVRGADLLDSTPRQIYLQQQLGYPTPEYCHLPLAVDSSGNKISKCTGASKVDLSRKPQLLVSVLGFLGQKPPQELARSSVNDIWNWAIANWDITQVSSKLHIQPGTDQK